MDPRRPSFGLTLVLVATALASLSCNAPDVADFAYDYVDSVLQAQASRRILQEDPELAAKIAEEGEPPAFPPDGAEWVCHDVDGELSSIRRNERESDTLVLKQVEFQLALNYSSDYEGLSIRYHFSGAMDSEVDDGVTGEFLRWETSSWWGDGLQSSVPLNYDGVFSGRFVVNQTRERNYPETIQSEVLDPHNFIGLIPPGDFQKIYFCDLKIMPIPSTAANLTPENFRSSCPLYYYECESK